MLYLDRANCYERHALFILPLWIASNISYSNGYNMTWTHWRCVLSYFLMVENISYNEKLSQLKIKIETQRVWNTYSHRFPKRKVAKPSFQESHFHIFAYSLKFWTYMSKVRKQSLNIPKCVRTIILLSLICSYKFL